MKRSYIAAPAAAIVASIAAAQNCDNTSVGFTPLSDLRHGTYEGQQGGLYPGGVNRRPPAHDDAGREIASRVRPLDLSGHPDPNGSVVMLSIGMSNTNQEFAAFIAAADAFPNINGRLRIVNGAQGGQDAIDISDPDSPYWDGVVARLAQQGLSPQQVQTVWLKEAIASPGVRFPDDVFPEDARRLQGHLEQIARNIRDKFPNARLCYLASRTYAGYATTNLNPEPYAYQSGFAAKWTIATQIDGDPALNFDPDRGPIEAPWLAWGPYLWADGLTPRSDGLTWRCEDFQPDGTHPSELGREKVAGILLDFFRADATTRPWFVRCVADFNDDGVRNTQDFLLFLNLWNASSPRADFNGDRVINSLDVLAFLNAWTTGC